MALATSAAGASLAHLARYDVADACEELAFVAAGASARLERLVDELEAAGGLRPRLRQELVREARRLAAWFADAERRVEELRRAASSAPDADAVERLAAERRVCADLVRSRLGLVGALVTAADWQSPSFGHSLRPAAGRQEGLIRPHWTDYKRDRHLDAAEYEDAYVSEYVGQAGLSGLLTACGMAALTTILCYLLGEQRLSERYVVIGRGLYHESKQLLYGAVPTRLIEVDERDPVAVELAVERFDPGAVFVDSLSNTSAAAVVHLPWLARLLAGRSRQTFLVVDATGTTAAAISAVFREPDPPRLLVWESLLKYCQLGLDRVNAGAILAPSDDAVRLSSWREHLGTNVADTTVATLPLPSRPLLFRRLDRLQRNAALIATRLDDVLEEAGGRQACEVISPLLPGHRCHDVATGLAFAGSCVNLHFRPREDEPGRQRRFVEQALAAARRRGVPLLAGSSFGFDATRIYVTAETARYGDPFLRMSAGAEDRLTIESVADALADALLAVAA